jgi:hypothetical protein
MVFYDGNDDDESEERTLRLRPIQYIIPFSLLAIDASTQFYHARRFACQPDSRR